MSIISRSINQWSYGADATGQLSKKVIFAQRPLYCSDNVELLHGASNGREVLIIGSCVDASGALRREDIAGHLCRFEFDDFVKAIEVLCGIYAILRSDGVSLRIFADATHMMPIYYGISGREVGVVASMECFIVPDVLNVSEAAIDVERCSPDRSRKLVSDMTMYDSVRCLLPNHYLDYEKNEAIRYFPVENLTPAKTEEEVNQIIDETIEFATNAAREFGNTLEYACPLTPGADSRLNSVLLSKLFDEKSIYWYVINNQEFSNEANNVDFVIQLAKKIGISDFHILQHKDFLDDGAIQQILSVCGKTRNWDKKAWAYSNEIGKRALINGQIIDQIGKASMAKGWSGFLAHWPIIRIFCGSTSRFAKDPFYEWYNETKCEAKNYSLFDLLAWEFRCGRWNSNLTSRNMILGIREVNLYNCTKIISSWCRIPREKRIQKVIHKKIIARLCPGIVDVPFNPYSFRHSRHLPPSLSKIVPYWCRDIVLYCLLWLKNSKKQCHAY